MEASARTKTHRNNCSIPPQEDEKVVKINKNSVILVLDNVELCLTRAAVYVCVRVLPAFLAKSALC